MKTLLHILATLAAAALLHMPAAQAAEPVAAGQKHRLVLQVTENDAKKWNTVLNNVHNIQVDLGPDKVQIEVVAYGPGIWLLTADSLVANRVEEAMETGVNFVACGNTMISEKLKMDDFVKGVEYAKAGIVRLMQRQQQGWAYIRP